MSQIMKCRGANLQEDNSTDTSLSWGEILVILASNLLLISMEPQFHPFPLTPFANLPGLRPAVNTAQTSTTTSETEIWINLMGVQEGMHTARVILFFLVQTRQIETQHNFELHTLHLTSCSLSW